MKRFRILLSIFLLLSLAGCKKSVAVQHAGESVEKALPAQAAVLPDAAPQTLRDAEPKTYLASEIVPDLGLCYAPFGTFSQLKLSQNGPVKIGYYAAELSGSVWISNTLCIGAAGTEPEYYCAANGTLTRVPAHRYEKDVTIDAYGETWHVLFDCWRTEDGLAVRNLPVKRENAAGAQALSENDGCVLLRGPDGKLALFDLENETAKAVLENLPAPASRVYPNGSASRYLFCREGENGRYTWFLDSDDQPLAALNDRAAAPACVRWRGETQLAYDIENPETGKFSTYLYDIPSETERPLLEEYDPYPFLAEDTAEARYLLVQDAYALRVERGGAVTICDLSDGTKQKISDFSLPDEYSTFFVGSGNVVFYRAGYQDEAWQQIGFIDCAAGNCAVLGRTVPPQIKEAFDLIPLGETAFALQASAEKASGTQDYLLVYDVSSWRDPPFTGGITLYADSRTALVNSEQVQMPAAPFEENGIFYIPLQFVAETMGWAYREEDGRITLSASVHQTALTAGERTIVVDGEEAAVRRRDGQLPAEDAEEDSYAPLERDGQVFIPLDYLSARTEEDISSKLSFRTQWFSADGYAIVSGRGKENGLGGFYVGDIYDDLPEKQRAGMEELGTVGISRDAYDVAEYGADGLFVHVLRLRDGCEDLDRFDGVISAVYTLDPEIPTPRGLRVGEDVSRIYTTYDSAFYMQLLCLTEDDVITQIRFTCIYDADERIQKQPENLHMDAAAAGQGG